MNNQHASVQKESEELLPLDAEPMGWTSLARIPVKTVISVAATVISVAH